MLEIKYNKNNNLGILKLSSDSSNGGAIYLWTLSAANITRCHFTSNYASGDGGAIYVATRSELEIFDSEFTLNAADNGGSVAAYMSDSLIESCSFTSSNASEDGGCIYLKVANVTMKQSNLSGCESTYQGVSMYLIQHSTLQLENVRINESYSREVCGAFCVLLNSELFVLDSAISGRSPNIGGIGCYITSHVHLESVALISCSSSIYYGCVYISKCNVTMDNITFMETDYAITVRNSTVINIFNSLALNDTTIFLTADSSHVTFWNMNISNARWWLVRATYVVDGRFFCHYFWKVEGTVRIHVNSHVAHVWLPYMVINVQDGGGAFQTSENTECSENFKLL